MKTLLTALLLLLVRSTCLQAALQVDLYMLTGTGQEVSILAIDCGAVAPGDFVEVRLRLRSRESQALLLKTDQFYATTTTGVKPVFSPENYPALPYTLGQSGNIDFRLRFAPKDPGTFRGTLYIFDKQISLTGTAPEGVTVQAQRAAGFETLQTISPPIDFGAVERNQSAARQFALINKTTQALSVRTLYTTSPGYALEGIAPPVTLAPGATRTFAVRFSPLQSGIFRGEIIVDGRVFQLEGFALEPPLPTLSFDTLPSLRSGQQATIKIRLSETSRGNANVKVSLAGIETDPAVSLLPGGGRTANVALKEGATELSTIIQTGSTAGTLKLTVEMAAQKLETQLVLAPMVPVMSTITGTRANGRIDLRISGFDNVRAMREAGFQFYDRTGAPVGGLIRTTVTDAFNKYYATSTLGGLFSLTASFPVIGDIESITSVEVELTNNQGTARSSKAQF
jgi:hypothetical protein